MRPVVCILVVPVLAASPALAGSAGLFRDGAPTGIDFSQAGSFGRPAQQSDDSDLLLRDQPNQPSAASLNLMPSVHVGPFRATLGGLNHGRGHLAYELDTRDFFNSTISGSVERRGARITFTMPFH